MTDTRRGGKGGVESLVPSPLSGAREPSSMRMQPRSSGTLTPSAPPQAAPTQQPSSPAPASRQTPNPAPSVNASALAEGVQPRGRVLGRHAEADGPVPVRLRPRHQRRQQQRADPLAAALGVHRDRALGSMNCCAAVRRPGRGLVSLYEEDFPDFTSTDLWADLQAATAEDPRQHRALSALVAAANLESHTRDFAVRATRIQTGTSVRFGEDDVPWRVAPGRARVRSGGKQ